jgi:hypothetical protein
VTVVRPDQSVEIIEVKSSNVKSGRKVRQRQEMTEIVTQLSTGEGRIEDRKTQIEILPVTPETGLDRVEELLKIAGAKAWRRPRSVIACTLRPSTFAESQKRQAPKNCRDV